MKAEKKFILSGSIISQLPKMPKDAVFHPSAFCLLPLFRHHLHHLAQMLLPFRIAFKTQPRAVTRHAHAVFEFRLQARCGLMKRPRGLRVVCQMVWLDEWNVEFDI